MSQQLDGPRQNRSGSDEYSTSSGSSAGSLNNVQEVLLDSSRRVFTVHSGHEQALVDNGAAISPELATEVSKKAFRLMISVKNSEGIDIYDGGTGQAGLIKSNRLDPTPEHKRRAVGDDRRPVGILRSRHFEAIPTSCLHNVDDIKDEHGDVFEYQFSTMLPITGEGMRVDSFDRTRLGGDAAKTIIRRADSTCNGNNATKWEPADDVTTANTVSNAAYKYTQEQYLFEKVTRPGYEPQVGQKVGIAVIRNFEVTWKDAGIARNSLSPNTLSDIYGTVQEGSQVVPKVIIHTGEITRVASGDDEGPVFEHNINTFTGCSGAIIFLLDRQDEENHGVTAHDYGKAIGVHVGGTPVQDGLDRNGAPKYINVNVGFKLS